ncbi:MAG TPA: DUF4159 domain-containing protein [Blastocatellia bacterium]|nr:DUF4159 domain-containing protein [Blastocatellia bacterium]
MKGRFSTRTARLAMGCLAALCLLLTSLGRMDARESDRTAEVANGVRLGEVEDVSDRFKFVRLRFGPLLPGAHIGDGGEPWSHDYPEAGIHFSKILTELSKLQVNIEENEYIFTFTDPNLFKYPFAYLAEVGYMELSDEEVAGMREYLLRGGFLLVDDFRGPWQLRNLQNHIKRALPEYEMKRLDETHPIFNCFFSIKPTDVRRMYREGYPEFWGVEDKNGRLMMVINYNYDVSDYWQWSNDPFQPIEDTNNAYKFGVNYVFYALTH